MIVRKVFWAWDDYKEEAWLRQMAQSGWHLVQVRLFTYIFVAGEPRDFVYRLDFIPTDKKKDEYFQLFRDAGWEHVDKLIGWEYWRKEAKAGESTEIFTDVESQSRKYRLLFRLELAVGLLLAADVIYMISLALKYGIAAVYSGMVIPLALLLVIFYVCLRLWTRIHQLRRL